MTKKHLSWIFFRLLMYSQSHAFVTYTFEINIILTLIYFCFVSITDCADSGAGDGFCDDEYNHIDCNFDGGDCCGSNVDASLCYICLCHGLFPLKVI